MLKNIMATPRKMYIRAVVPNINICIACAQKSKQRYFVRSKDGKEGPSSSVAEKFFHVSFKCPENNGSFLCLGCKRLLERIIKMEDQIQKLVQRVNESSQKISVQESQKRMISSAPYTRNKRTNLMNSPAGDHQVGSDRLIKVPSPFSVLPSPSNSSQKSPNALLNSAGAADADQNLHVGKNCEPIIQEKNNSSTYYPRFNQQCYTENPEVSLTLSSVQSLPIDVNQKQPEQGAASNQNFNETADNSSVALPVVKLENVSNSCPFPSLQACPSNTKEGQSCSCCICGIDFQGSKALDEHVLIYHGNELPDHSSMECASESPYIESKDNSLDASANNSKTESEDEQVFTKKIKIEPDDYNEFFNGASYDESVTSHASAKTNTRSHYSGDSFPRTIVLNFDLRQTRMSHGPVIETSSAMEHDNNSHVAPSNSNLDLSSQSIATRFSPDNSHMYITQASRLVSHPVSSNQSPSLTPIKPIYITVNPHELSCYLCSERFSHITQILDHITCHQGEVPKKCTCMACGAFFTNMDSMKRHISNVHLDIKYQCSYCSVYFTRTDNLRKHIREVHGVRFMKQ